MITSLSDDLGLTTRRQSAGELDQVYHKLHNFIDKINEKIFSRIQLVQQVYLDDYKEQVSVMAAELKSIRGVLDEELLKQRSNEKLFYLEEERDFFRAQVIKLNEDLRKMTQDNNKLKTGLSESQHECANYKKIVYELETRIYKLTYENLEIEKMKNQTVKNEATTKVTSPTNLQGRSELDPNTGRKVSVKTFRDFEDGEETLRRQKTQYSLRKLKPSRSMGGNPVIANLLKAKVNSTEASKREEILDQCIKEIKKEIYYRNIQFKESAKIHFDEHEKVPFQKFTKTDKKDLVFRLMSDPNILEQFYKFMLGKKTGMNQTLTQENTSQYQTANALDKIAISKGIDARFNTKMLSTFKAEFDKRIYDIKANRV